MDMKLPFSTTGMMLHIDDSMDYEVLSSSIESMPKSDKTEDEIVLEAMEHPIGSPKLSELAKGKENVVIICSDHTRPVPSKHIIPFMLKEIREGNPLELLKEYLKILTPRERKILDYRYGLNNKEEKTQKEIAKIMGISRSYVSRIEKRAITKILREFIRDKKYSD